MAGQKEIKETIDIHGAISSINLCLGELDTMQEEIDQYESLEFGSEENPPKPGEINSYCRLQSTRANILNSMIQTNLKLVAKVLPDAVQEPSQSGEGDIDAITAKDSIVERFSSLVREPRPTQSIVTRLN